MELTTKRTRSFFIESFEETRMSIGDSVDWVPHLVTRFLPFMEIPSNLAIESQVEIANVPDAGREIRNQRIHRRPHCQQRVSPSASLLSTGTGVDFLGRLFVVDRRSTLKRWMVHVYVPSEPCNPHRDGRPESISVPYPFPMYGFPRTTTKKNNSEGHAVKIPPPH